MPTPDLSVIIVSYNTCGLLRSCLLSLQRVADEAALEIVVVDNASRDGSGEMVVAEFPEVKLVRCDANLGFAAGMNRGLETATAPIFMSLNPDTIVPRSALRTLLDFLREHPRAAIAGAAITFPDGRPQPSNFREPALFREFWNLLPELKFLLKLRKVSEMLKWNRGGRRGTGSRLVDCVSGAGFVARIQAVREAGGYDEAFFLYHEEMDLCIRLRKAGLEVWSVGDAQVIHFDAQASGYRQSRLPDWPVLGWRLMGMKRLWQKHRTPRQLRRWAHQTRWLLGFRISLLTLKMVAMPDRSGLEKRRKELRRVRALLLTENYGNAELMSPI